MASLVTPANGDLATAELIAQLTEMLSGLRNIPMSLSGINDASAYAETIRNAGTGGKGLIVYAADGSTVLLQVDGSGVLASRAGAAAERVLTTGESGTITQTMLASSIVGAWTTFTPTMTQSASLTVTVTYAAYLLIGKLAVVQMRLAITSAGTASNNILVGSIPAAIAPKRTDASAISVAGTFLYFDASAPLIYQGGAAFNASTTLTLLTTGVANAFGLTPAVTAANGDLVSLALAYEVA